MSQQFQDLVEREKDRVYSFAVFYLSCPTEAEDVTQEVLIKLWQCLGELDLESVGAWLRRVTRNACFDRLRRRRVRRASSIEEGGGAAEASPAPDPESAAAATAFQNHLRQALAELPEPYRSVVLMRELGEMKYEEIAASLEVPLNTVKTHLFRGRRWLRERLKVCHGYEGSRQLLQ